MKEARILEAKWVNDLSSGRSVVPSKATMTELLDSWLQSKKGSVSPNSYRDYEIAIRRHIKPAVGHVHVGQLTAAGLQDTYDTWRVAGMSARMIHRCHLVLNQALSRSVRVGLALHNPASFVSRPSIEQKSMQVWDSSELAQFLDAAENDALAPLWHLLALEGMRRGEALGLRWADINWERGAAHISQTVVPDKNDRGRATIVPRTKTRAGARSVRLSRQTLDALKAHRTTQQLLRAKAVERWQDHDLIVCTSQGTPVNPNNVSRGFQRLVVEAGLKSIRVHDLRHSAATMLLRAGIPAKIVSERLGHAGIGITLDLYSHVTPDMQDAAAEAVSSIIDSASASLGHFEREVV
jgi:integrase